jgi:hypothetical protein
VPLLRTELAAAGSCGVDQDRAPRPTPPQLPLETTSVRAGQPRLGRHRKRGLHRSGSGDAGGRRRGVRHRRGCPAGVPAEARRLEHARPAGARRHQQAPKATDDPGVAQRQHGQIGAHGARALPHRRRAGRRRGAGGGAARRPQAAELRQRFAPPAAPGARCRHRSGQHGRLAALSLPGVDAAGGVVARAENHRGHQSLLRLAGGLGQARPSVAGRYGRRRAAPLWASVIEV